MQISPTMDLDQLAERMYVDGAENPNMAKVSAMRDLINADAEAFEWTRTNDIEDCDWFRMLHQAVKIAAAHDTHPI